VPPPPDAETEDISYTGFNRVDVHLGNHGNAFTIASTNAGATTSVHGGSGSDSIKVLAVTGAAFVNAGADDDEITVGSRSRLLDGILGPLSVNGQTHTTGDTLNIVDSGRAEPRDYSLTGTSFARTDLPTIDYASIERLNIALGTGQNRLEAEDLPDEIVTTIKGTVARGVP
jgi:hypothetical protein